MKKVAKQDFQELSIDQEMKVARTFVGRIEWEMIVIELGQFVLWVVI